MAVAARDAEADPEFNFDEDTIVTRGAEPQKAAKKVILLSIALEI